MIELEQKKQVFDDVYLICLSCLSLINFLNETVGQAVVDEKIVLLAQFMVCSVLGLAIIGQLICDRAWNWKELILVSLVMISFLGSWMVIHRAYVFDFLLLFIGARHLSAKKIISVYLGSMLVGSLFFIILSSGGFIPNLFFYQISGVDGAVRTRMTFGYIYPTYFAAHVFFIIMCYVWIRSYKISFIELIIFCLLAVFCGYFSDTRTTSGCIVILSFLLLVMKMLRKYSWTRYGEELQINGVLQFLGNIFPAVCAFVMLTLTNFYDENNIKYAKLNQFLSGRLAYGKQGFNNYNIKLFGNEIIEGNTLFGDFFLDCSYINIILKLGILAFITVLILLFYLIYKENKAKHWEHVLVIMMLCLHSMLEHRLVLIAYQPFLLLCLAFSDKTENEPKYNTIEENREASFGDNSLKSRLAVLVFLIIFAYVGINSFRTVNMSSTDIKSKKVYYADDYDLPKDGTDCTSQFMGMIDMVYSQGGGTIYLGEGIYGLKMLRLTNNVNIIGQGKGKTILKYIPNDTEMDSFIYASNCYIDFSVENLEISGEDSCEGINGIEFPTQSTALFEYDESSTIRFKDVYVHDFLNNGCFIASDNQGIVFDGCIFENNRNSGMEVISTDIVIENCVFKDNGKYGVINSGNGNQFHGIICENNGVLDDQSVGFFLYASDCNVSDIVLENNNCHALSVMGDNNTITELICENNGYRNDTNEPTTTLVYIEGNNNKIEGECRQSKEICEPLNLYAVYSNECKDCQIDIKIDKKCSVNGNCSN